MNLMKDYNKAKQAIYDHVEFVEDWVVCPMDDRTDMYWSIDGDTVKYAKTKEELLAEDDNYYEDEIYTQRFYKKHIYVGVELTMVFCDTHTDGMKYFAVFSNDKEVKE